ncbi:hypothetical protein BGW38_000791 [Lunasporangiospora selenospora]|uniref:Wbp11/ELF5/Saf1 N-terminal domain-containing protein n=1 Tax=Lunasporangiospora selenospora TaxID=979761 RepID=A0A9P6G1Z0_9FUNG|nr:hypothetical protein BGW38_000791 [Lunasporangiospora selenospora]
MGRRSGRSLNPADQYRKDQHKKEKKKNKQDRKKVRQIGSALKDTITEPELVKYEDLEKSGKLDKDEQKKLAELRERMTQINDIKKAHGIKVKPKKTDAEKEAPVAVAEPARDPTRSIYYDPVLNPYGAPPPGQPYLEYPPLPSEMSPFSHADASAQDPPKEAADSEQDSDSDSDDSDSDSDSDSESSSESEIDEDDERFMPPLPEGPAPPKNEQERFSQLSKPKPAVDLRRQTRYQQHSYPPPQRPLGPGGPYPSDGRSPGIMMPGPPGQGPPFNHPYGAPPGFRPPFNNSYPPVQPGVYGTPLPVPFPGYNGPPPMGPPGMGPPGMGPPGMGPPGFGPPGYGPPPDAYGPPMSHRPSMRPPPPPSSYRPPPPSRTPRPPRISNPQSDPMTGHLPMDEKEAKKQAVMAERAANANRGISGDERASLVSNDSTNPINASSATHALPPRPGAGLAPPGLPTKKPALVAGPTSISAQPQLRNLQKELVHLVPSTIMRKRVSQKGKIGRPVNAAPGVDDDDNDERVETRSSSKAYDSTLGLIPESITRASVGSMFSGSSSSLTSSPDKNGVEQEHRESSLLGLRLPRVNLAPSVDLSSIGAGSMKLSVNSAPDVSVTTASAPNPAPPVDREKKKKQEYNDFLQSLEGDGLL